MPHFVLHRVFRAIFIGAFAATYLLNSEWVSAEISISGGTPETQSRLKTLIAERFDSRATENLELAITVGIPALIEQCSLETRSPIIATGLYESRFLEVAGQCSRPVVGIPADAPWVYQQRLTKKLFPGAKLATLINDAEGEALIPRPGVEAQLPVPGEGVAKSLGRLINEGRWDVFLLPIDHTVYSNVDYRLAVETLVRHRKPAIASVRPLLTRGAAAATYYTPAQLEEALLESIDQFIETGVLIGKRPREVRVGVNETVLRNLFGRVITADELRLIEAEVNGG